MQCNVETKELFSLEEWDHTNGRAKLSPENRTEDQKSKNLAEFMQMFYPHQKEGMKPRGHKKPVVDPEDIVDEEDDYGEN